MIVTIFPDCESSISASIMHYLESINTLSYYVRFSSFAIHSIFSHLYVKKQPFVLSFLNCFYCVLNSLWFSRFISCISLCSIEEYSSCSILKQHALLIWSQNEVTLKPATSGAKTKVNGLPLTGERVLKHLDRILFGKFDWEKINMTYSLLLKWPTAVRDLSMIMGYAIRTCYFYCCIPFFAILQSYLPPCLPLVTAVSSSFLFCTSVNILDYHSVFV